MPSKKTKKRPPGRPALHGEVLFVRVHGDVQDKITRAAKRQKLTKQDLVRKLISENCS